MERSPKQSPEQEVDPKRRTLNEERGAQSRAQMKREDPRILNEERTPKQPQKEEGPQTEPK